ncbi:monosaccharide-transporting ATPase [Christensenellaceae bacterium]|nr:monosaccharide-transporting ATPase [Christensenellaceae bacterium]BDF60641.1 monosaccharide-transporting ATPase [Christensenellaceae bacterium]
MPDEKALEMKNITKSFMGVHALKNVNFTACKGKVNILIGENGAGKSTLMKILAGVYPKDSGEIVIDGKTVEINNPNDSMRNKIAMIYQELNLCRDMTVQENVFLGKEITKGMLIDKKETMKRTVELMEKYEMGIRPDEMVGSLSVAKQQMLEIVKALSEDAKILVMDEPTSSLTLQEVEHLFRIIKQLTANGVTIIYISHRMEELFEIGDYITVMRDGEFISENPIANVTQESLIASMVGREITQMFPKQEVPIGDTVLEVKGLSKKGMYRDVSFELRRGEILGFSGLVGAGRTEVAMSVFGAIKPDAGTILIDGKEVKIRSPYDAIKHKLAYLPEDRKLLGVDLNSKIRNNISVTNMDKIANKGGFLNFKKEEEICTNAVKQLRIKTPSIMQLVGNLSGGNQQKVAIAKWITRDIDVLILDEPTRGVDVGAKEEIHKMIVELARQGIGIVLISSELPEVLGMSDRVVVMHEGEIKAMLNAQEATQELVMSYSVGSEEKVQGGIC